MCDKCVLSQTEEVEIMESETKEKSLNKSFSNLTDQAVQGLYILYVLSLIQFKCHYHIILLPPGPSLSSEVFISNVGTGVERAEGWSNNVGVEPVRFRLSTDSALRRR